MDTLREAIGYRGYTVEIHYNDCPENPREWNNLGKMICFHSRYNLGDKHNYTVGELKGLITEKDVVSLPLYLYDHSGVTLTTSDNFTGYQSWDTSMVGYIITTKQEIRRWFNVKRVTKKILKKAIERLKVEVKVYNYFLNGEVYGWIVPELDESGWGYYGYEDLDLCEQDAKNTIDAHIRWEMNKRIKYLKRVIKVHVPLIYRKPYKGV